MIREKREANILLASFFIVNQHTIEISPNCLILTAVYANQ